MSLKSFLKLIALTTIGACTLTACGSITESPETLMGSPAQENSMESHGRNDNGVISNAGTSTESDTANAITESNSNTIEHATSEPTATPEPTPVPATITGRNGALSVQGADLVNEHGEKFQLYGMSTHGIAWYPQFVSYDSFRTLRDDWNTNCVRLAMYTAEESGYCTDGDKEQLKALVKNGVKYATELGMYVIIDWHILSDQDPNVYKADAIAFFEEMSATYADYNNVLYEICNEPNGYATWDSVKSYANEVIPTIRTNDPDAVIIVGTPTWSQDIDKAAASPLEYDNILYALHFYAGTHKTDLRNRLDSCVKSGLPVFISEFGMCDASGNGANDFDSTSKWFELIEEHNLSFCCWNLANKDESSSVFKSSTVNVSDWSEDEMNESGKWIREYFRGKRQG